jgi:hypothetical protein
VAFLLFHIVFFQAWAIEDWAITDRHWMRNAEQIADMAQSEYVWNLYIRSKLFLCGASNAEILNEARSILQNKLMLFADYHPELERINKALERLKLRIRSFAAYRETDA